MDIENLSVKELTELRKKIDRAIAGYEDRKRKEAVAAAEAAAREHGFSLNELTGAKPGRSTTVSVPKYANPQDRSQTWTGRGRRPNWVQQALAEGKNLEDLAI
ncbi:H-NS histone family protein [Paracoccus jeotgali]|uniref:Transcriptional regulator n=1 Tax=Paracoccus jeotgali TaxID=2065379 RepID=A0A2K9MKQ7_9RHOB|nr:H-NS histone family protein [Paracoccus jeotgali]AUM75195.1 transcriptional regulator [Paracoccus jeotgali]